MRCSRSRENPLYTPVLIAYGYAFRATIVVRDPNRRIENQSGMSPGGRVMKASARHILVKTEQTCEDLKKKIEGGTDFADVAREHSECPSGKQ